MNRSMYMKLSIHLLYDRISTTNSKLVTNENINFNLSSIRNYPGSSKILSNNVLYVVSSDDIYTISSEESLSFICLGKVDEKYLNNNDWSAILMPYDTPTIDLINEVQDIFDEYNLWKEEVSEAIFHRESLQSIFDLSSRYLKNPIAFFDHAQGLIMKSGALSDKNLDAIWNFVLNKGYSINESESELLKKKISNSRFPFYYRSPDAMGHITRLIAPVQVHGSPFGVLAMTDINALITEAEYTNMILVRDIMENALLVSEEYKSFIDLPWYLYRLLTNQHIEKSLVSHHLSIKMRKIEERYFLWCFSPMENILDDHFSIQSYIPFMKRQFGDNMIFCYDNQIIICDYNIENKNDKKLKAIINDFLLRSNFKGATSMFFNNIFEIHHAFIQCQIVLEKVEKNNNDIYDFNSVINDYIIEGLRKNTAIESVIYPGLRKLKIKEDAYHRELLFCLQSYIIHGQNVSATAKCLFIHRHTVIYRLDNIMAITGIQFDELNEDALFHIYLSCKLLLGE